MGVSVVAMGEAAVAIGEAAREVVAMGVVARSSKAYQIMPLTL